LDFEVRYERWDIETPRKRELDVDVLVHSAAYVDDWGPPEAFFCTNVRGTANVLACTPSTTRFVHLSSASVYDLRRDKSFVREHDLPRSLAGLDSYSYTKHLAEQLVFERKGSVVLRPHAVYGPGDPHIVPRWLGAIRFGWMPLLGAGKNRISVTHVDNLASAVVLAVEHPTASGVYNVADAEALEVRTMIELLLERAGLQPRIVMIPERAARFVATTSELVARAFGGRPLLTRQAMFQLTREFVLDISRAERELGYIPRASVWTAPRSRSTSTDISKAA
jgi:nucleoside-diphosphate-sugar epimerase